MTNNQNSNRDQTDDTDIDIQSTIKSFINNEFDDVNADELMSDLLAVDGDEYLTYCCPLTPQQIQLMNDENIREWAEQEMTKCDNATVEMTDNPHHLLIKMNSNIPLSLAIYTLESKLGMLMTKHEIKETMNDINQQQNEEEDEDTPDQIYLRIHEKCDDGILVLKYDMFGDSEPYYVTIDNARMYWKEKQTDDNQNSKYIQLSTITDVVVGKKSRFRKPFDDLDEKCFNFRIETTFCSYYFSTNNPIDCTEFVSFLRSLLKHFAKQSIYEYVDHPLQLFQLQTIIRNLKHKSDYKHILNFCQSLFAPKFGCIRGLATDYGDRNEIDWMNVCENGKVKICVSSVYNSYCKPDNLVDSLTDNNHFGYRSSNFPHSWFIIDFRPSQIQIKPHKYTLKHTNYESDYHLRTWNLEGRYNHNKWMIVSQHINDESLTANTMSVQHTWNINEMECMRGMDCCHI